MTFHPIRLCLALLFISTTGLYAQDSTYHKNSWYITVGGGYASNRAFGSLVTMVSEIDQRDWGVKHEVQKNGGAYEINVTFLKQFSGMGYFKTGLSYVQKQVNPEEASYPLYKDSLKTGYLVMPAMAGLFVPVDLHKTVLFTMELGPTTNFKLTDKTIHGPDRAGFKTFPVVLGLQAGAGLTFKGPSGFGVQLLYTYRQDLTNTYNESLYWGAPNEPIRTRAYKFRTNSVSFGLMWRL